MSKKAKKRSSKKARGSVVPVAYKTRYAATSGGKSSCGDSLSELLAKATQNAAGKTDLKKLAKIKKENKIEASRWNKLNPGMQRMNLGNVLRGIIRSGGKIRLNGKAVKK